MDTNTEAARTTPGQPGTDTGTGRSAAPRTGSHTGPAAGEDRGPGARTADTTTNARARIDELDARIIELVQERRAVSAGIQQARIEAGGRRVELAREMKILDRYREALGRSGTQLAMTLLALCRGQL